MSFASFSWSPNETVTQLSPRCATNEPPVAVEATKSPFGPLMRASSEERQARVLSAVYRDEPPPHPAARSTTSAPTIARRPTSLSVIGSRARGFTGIVGLRDGGAAGASGRLRPARRPGRAEPAAGSAARRQLPRRARPARARGRARGLRRGRELRRPALQRPASPPFPHRARGRRRPRLVAALARRADRAAPPRRRRAPLDRRQPRARAVRRPRRRTRVALADAHA